MVTKSETILAMLKPSIRETREYHRFIDSLPPNAFTEVTRGGEGNLGDFLDSDEDNDKIFVISQAHSYPGIDTRVFSRSKDSAIFRITNNLRVVRYFKQPDGEFISGQRYFSESTHPTIEAFARYRELCKQPIDKLFLEKADNCAKFRSTFTKAKWFSSNRRIPLLNIYAGITTEDGRFTLHSKHLGPMRGTYIPPKSLK